MKANRTGFSKLVSTSERLGIDIKFGKPVVSVPANILGSPLDPELRSLYEEHDGVRMSAPEFELVIYPLSGPDALEWRNASLRRHPEDFTPPYPFEKIVVFAQYDKKAAYLGAVPQLADENGLQPVLYIDAHESVWAIPIAKSVDGAFQVLSRFLEKIVESHGSLALSEVQFPLSAHDLVIDNSDFGDNVLSRDLKEFIGNDPVILEWIRTGA